MDNKVIDTISKTLSVNATEDIAAVDGGKDVSGIDTPSHQPEINISKRRFKLLENCAEITAIVRVQCPVNCCNLVGTTVLITSDRGDEFEVELTRFNGVENETEEFRVQTGEVAGEYTWTATYIPCTVCGIQHEKAEHSFSFDYRPHSISIAVWDMPLVAEGDGSISLKVGAKCNCGCSLEGMTVRVLDANSNECTQETMGKDLWPGTASLHWKELTFGIPEKAGTYTYTLEVDGIEGHCPSKKAFTFVVAEKTSSILEVCLIDGTTKLPVMDVAMAVGPYIETTEGDGKARFPVNPGKVRITANPKGYQPLREDIWLTGSSEIVLELTPKPRYAEDY